MIIHDEYTVNRVTPQGRTQIAVCHARQDKRTWRNALDVAVGELTAALRTHPGRYEIVVTEER